MIDYLRRECVQDYVISSFGEITDNISETVHNTDIVTVED